MTRTRPPEARSRITNGKALLPGVDGRSLWARRMRDVMELLAGTRGGWDALDPAEQLIVRRAAVLEAELTRLEMGFAKAGEADVASLMLYRMAADTQRRLMESIGLRGRPKDITPDLGGLMRKAS